MKKYTVYAPVIITTLCRFVHFKRCIDSLSRCTGACYTDVYIGIDFPTRESHWDGYNKICDYVGGISGFKNVFVIKRDSNLGPLGNMSDLCRRARMKYDRYIISEDDNEFAPNFLEYMNACLEKYKNDPRVIRICGCLQNWNADYSGCMKLYPYNAFPAADYNAWGYGGWFTKPIKNNINKDECLKSLRLTIKIILHGYALAVQRFVHYRNSKVQFPDICLRIYCSFNHVYAIFPTVSKVRNWGYDGSGVNCGGGSKWFDNMVLDDSLCFELDDFEIKDYKMVKRLIRSKYNKLSYIRTALYEYFAYRTGLLDKSR